MDNIILNVLRDQAWERAKGELQAMLGTIYGDKEYFDTLDILVNEFVKNVKENL